MGHRNGRNLKPALYVVEEAWTERVGSVEYEDRVFPWLADFEQPDNEPNETTCKDRP